VKKIPARLRRAGYRVFWLGTPAVTYAAAKGYIGAPELVLWGSYGTFFGFVADRNVTEDPEPAPGQD